MLLKLRQAATTESTIMQQMAVTIPGHHDTSTGAAGGLDEAVAPFCVQKAECWGRLMKNFTLYSEDAIMLGQTRTWKSLRSCWYRRSIEHGANSVIESGNGSWDATRKLCLRDRARFSKPGQRP